MKIKIGLISGLAFITIGTSAQTAEFDADNLFAVNEDESVTIFFELMADEAQHSTVAEKADAIGNLVLTSELNKDGNYNCEVNVTGTVHRQVVKRYMQAMGIMNFVFAGETYEMEMLDRVVTSTEDK